MFYRATRQLTQATYKLRAQRRSSRVLALLAITLMGVCMGLGIAYAVQSSTLSPEAALQKQIASLLAENHSLKQLQETARLKSEHDAAMRAELEQALQQTTEELKKLRADLAFMRSHEPGKPVKK